MSDEEIDLYIEKKTGKKITWPKGAKVNGLPIKTINEVNQKLSKTTGKRDNELDR